MSGSNPTPAVSATVLAAMMDDLGDHRIEELAKDDKSRSRFRPTASRNTAGGTKSARPPHSTARRNSLSKRYHAAIEDGVFDDDDAAGVSGLDPLDGGNAHRVKDPTRQPFGQSRLENQVLDAVGAHSKRPRYDPSQPTFRKVKTKRVDGDIGYSPRVSRHSDTPNDLHVSSLGGIVPEGGEVKRWNPERPRNGTLQIDDLMMLKRPAGRGRFSLGPASTLRQPAQVTGCGRGRSGPLSSPLEKFKVDHESSIRQPQKGASRGAGEQVPQTPPTGLHSSATPNAESESSSNTATSWIAPHLRKENGSRSSASWDSVVAKKRSPQRSEAIVVNVLDQDMTICKIPTLNAREIFLRQRVLMLPQGGADNKLAQGQIILYELLDAPVGIWELIVEGENYGTRGDIRELLEVLPNGSTVYLRRHRKGGPVRSNPLRFSTIDEATTFMNEANVRRNQYSSSSETIHAETVIQPLPVQDAAKRGTIGESNEKDTSWAAVKSAKTSENKVDGLGLAKQPRQQRPDQEELKLAIENGHFTIEPLSQAPAATTSAQRPEPNGKATTCGGPEIHHRASPHESGGAFTGDSQLSRTLSSNVGRRPNSPQHALAIALPATLTLAKQMDGNDEPGRSGWSDDESNGSDDDLISFTPERKGGPLKPPPEKTREAVKKEVLNALRDLKALDGVSVPKDLSSNSLQVSWGISVSQEVVMKSFSSLKILLGGSQDPALMANLLHLVEIDEFLSLSREEQKGCLKALCTLVRGPEPRIVRSQKEISGLRSGDEVCPEEIEDLNMLIRRGKYGCPRQRRLPLPSQGPMHSRQSSTADTMTMLADQLGSLSMS